ncbi:4930_t:CDS:2 [Ambispora gerdemannii]|uniref:non-specific serine/threonine protein kinase n=1 Tax=Ambispora gerdemannii TaxID=144530 RepID=A0A9N9AN04_9GLOM|nr:4930_t:CDS:2 [Ambispora gerdemannii]
MIDNAVLIKQGAEARIYIAPFLTRKAIVKERFSKSYRHPILDKKLTARRVTQEARCLHKCRRSGLDTPVVYFVDIENNTIYMEYVEGKTVRDILREQSDDESFKSKNDEMANKIGMALANMHVADVIHGDLTTSNLLSRDPTGSLVVIDFGLSYVSILPEDKAVDLYVLERAFMSTHPNSETMFASILETYRKKYKDSGPVINKLEEEAENEV